MVVLEASGKYCVVSGLIIEAGGLKELGVLGSDCSKSGEARVTGEC